MKLMVANLIVGIAFGAVLLDGRIANAGPIPYAFIQSEEITKKAKACEDLEKQHSEILKKISELKHEEEKYIAELNGIGKQFCEK